MVNRGGEKIAPREVDEALLQHPAVAQAVALRGPASHAGRGRRPRPSCCGRGHANEQALRDWLRRRVADVKVPSRIVLVDDIPAGATGKVARAELASALADRLGHAQAPARRPDRDRRRRVVRDVLGHDGVGVNDNFFALGGDSLQGAEVTMRLQAIFGVELGGAALFRLPSVAELAGFIRAHTQSPRRMEHGTRPTGTRSSRRICRPRDLARVHGRRHTGPRDALRVRAPRPPRRRRPSPARRRVMSAAYNYVSGRLAAPSCCRRDPRSPTP